MPAKINSSTINVDHKDQERAGDVTLPLDGSEVTLGAGQRHSFRRWTHPRSSG